MVNNMYLGLGRFCGRTFKKLTNFAVYVGSTLLIGTAAMAMDEIFEQPYPYVTSESDVHMVLADLGHRAGLVVRFDEAVTGSVTLDNKEGSVGSLLDEALSQVGATWWYDGMVLYIEPQAGLTTELVLSQGLSLASIDKELAALELNDKRFPLKATDDGAVIRVVGPQGRVAQVSELIGILIDTRRALTGMPDGRRIYSPHILQSSKMIVRQERGIEQ